jgi:hypothetical protein
MKWLAMESAIVVVGPQISCRWLVYRPEWYKSTSRKGAPKIFSASSGRDEEEV